MTTDTQRTPDSLSTQAQNELICEKLLGWKRSVKGSIVAWSGWHNGTPSFTTWAEAGLILDALAKDKAYSAAVGFDPRSQHADWCGAAGYLSAHAATGPLAIRAAALAYIRSQS